MAGVCIPRSICVVCGVVRQAQCPLDIASPLQRGANLRWMFADRPGYAFEVNIGILTKVKKVEVS